MGFYSPGFICSKHLDISYKLAFISICLTRTQVITDKLENLGYEVFRIPAGDMHDRCAMAKHFFRIGCFLVGKEQARQLRQQPNWFNGQEE